MDHTRERIMSGIVHILSDVIHKRKTRQKHRSSVSFRRSGSPDPVPMFLNFFMLYFYLITGYEISFIGLEKFCCGIET